jgi:hypothetical protein
VAAVLAFAKRAASACERLRSLEENPLDILPLKAASKHLPPRPVYDPDAPGRFAFANADQVRSPGKSWLRSII